METETDVIMMRECSVRLERCELMIGKNMKTESGALAVTHEVRPRTPSATTPATRSYACKQAEAVSTLVTFLGLRVSMDGGDHLHGGRHALWLSKNLMKNMYCSYQRSAWDKTKKDERIALAAEAKKKLKDFKKKVLTLKNADVLVTFHSERTLPLPYLNTEEDHDELSTVVIKIEYDEEVCPLAGNLDFKQEELRQDCLIDTSINSECDIITKKEDEICKVIKQDLCIDATVLQRSAVPAEVYCPQQCPITSCKGNETTSLDTIAVKSTSPVKMEEHRYEDSCEESNTSKYNFVTNITCNANEKTLPERGHMPVEAQEKGRCARCGSVLTECKCRTGMANIKLDTLTDRKVYECEYCGYLTNKKTRLIIHVRIHMAKEPEELSFKLRKRRRTAEKPYRCDRCEYTTSDRHYLKSHIRVHTDEKPYKCEECEFRTSYLSALKIHIRTHTGEKPYRCEQCEYTTSDRGNLKSHKRVHTNEKPYGCKHCKYRTSYSTALTRHMRIHTGEKPYECEQCKYRTSYLTVLKDHMRIHTGEKPYRCEQCEYATSDKSRLKRHMRMHSGKKPYRCDQCEFTTSDQMYLKSHIRVHTGEKRYACKYCKYRTSYSCALKRHMCKHTGERPYGCEQCEYRATHLTALKAHMRTHSDVKPYRCEHCEYTTCHRGHLKRHIGMHNGEKPYACKQCEYRTSYSTVLQKHMRAHADENI